jgi:1-acyl-sn-glycerol-3-phosphate acyltransferase
VAARSEPLAARIGRGVVGAYCRREIARTVELTVEGEANLPPKGPLLLVARHVHHLLDGCILTTRLGRPLHVLVAVDWAKPGPRRRLLDVATALLRWPTILRDDAPTPGTADERRRRLIAATRETVALLLEGEALLIFPEGYPIVDPHPTPKTSLDDFLPFRQGFARLANLAGRSGAGDVPIVPVGFWYGERPSGWRVIVRFGSPFRMAEFPSTTELGTAVEASVRALSAPPAGEGNAQPRAPRGRIASGT